MKLIPQKWGDTEGVGGRMYVNGQIKHKCVTFVNVVKVTNLDHVGERLTSARTFIDTIIYKLKFNCTAKVSRLGREENRYYYSF